MQKQGRHQCKDPTPQHLGWVHVVSGLCEGRGLGCPGLSPWILQRLYLRATPVLSAIFVTIFNYPNLS